MTEQAHADNAPDAAARATVHGVRAAALLLAASTLLSRVLGYGRDWLINYQFGATGQTDVYQASFTLPDFLNYLLAGGALSVSLLPRMAALYAGEARGDGSVPQGETDRVFSVICTAMLVVASLLVVVAWLGASPFVGWWFHGFSADKVAQTVALTRIVLPAQLFFLLGGLFQAALLAKQRFAAMALTPLLYNLGIIVGGLIGGQTGQIAGFSWGALVGAALGGLVVPVWSARGQLRPRWLWQPSDPEIRRFVWVAAPLMIGVSLTTVDEWLAKRYGSGLPSGAISWLMSARRLMLVPIGLLGTAAGQAAGTYLAKLHAEGQRDELARLLAGSLAAVMGLSLVLTAGLLPLAEPVVAALYQYGKFSPEDVRMTALALVPLSLGIAAWGGQQVLARAFYATGDTWRPMMATTAVTLLMLPVYDALAHWRGHEIQGLCLAGTIGIAVQLVVLAGLARRRLGLDLRALLIALGRALAVAAACLVSVRWTQRAVTPHWADWLTAWALPQSLVRLMALLPGALAWLATLVAVGAVLDMPGLPRPLARWMARWRRDSGVA